MLCQLPHFNIIEITGFDALTFLQGQLSCDVEAVNEKISALGACCNNQGRVICNFRLYYFNKSYYLRLAASVAEKTLVHLKKFAVFSKVEIQIHHELHVYGMTDSDTHITDLPSELNHCVNNQACIVCKVADNRYEILSQETITSTAETKAWDLAEIKTNIVNIEIETTEQFTPHDIGLEKIGAINFEKGCYQGQEIIARMHYRGTRKQHLYQATINAKPILGETVFCEDNKVGAVINAAETDAGEYVLLVTLKDDAVSKKLMLKNKIALHIR